MAKSVKKATVTPKATAKPRKAAVKTQSTLQNLAPISISREQIAQLAHRFWAERGHAHGHHEEDWYRAEQELRKKAS